MTRVDLEPLRKFLKDSAAPEHHPLVDKALAALEPFRALAETGSYPLDREVIPGETAEVIAMAVGKTVSAVIPISASRLYPGAPGPGMRNRRKLMKKALSGPGMSAALNKGLGDRGRKTLKRLKDGFWEGLAAALWGTLGKPMLDSWKAGWTAGVDPDLMVAMGDGPWMTVGLTLYWFLALAVCGDSWNLDRYAPLVGTLTKCIPLTEKKDQPGTWLVLTA